MYHAYVSSAAALQTSERCGYLGCYMRVVRITTE